MVKKNVCIVSIYATDRFYQRYSIKNGPIRKVRPFEFLVFGEKG